MLPLLIFEQQTPPTQRRSILTANEPLEWFLLLFCLDPPVLLFSLRSTSLVAQLEQRPHPHIGLLSLERYCSYDN